MEFNKLFAAILVAGIIASLSGFIADLLVHPQEHTEFAYNIEAAEDSGVGAVAVAMPEPILAMIGAADIERGKTVAKACAACHTFDPNGANGTGPNLHKIVGRAMASHAGFSYSAALKEKGGSWTYADLNHFLWKPKAYIKGTAMNFIGVKKPEDRAALIAYLRSVSGDPALPSAADIATETAELGPKEATAEANPAVPADTAPSDPAQH